MNLWKFAVGEALRGGKACKGRREVIIKAFLLCLFPPLKIYESQLLFHSWRKYFDLEQKRLSFLSSSPFHSYLEPLASAFHLNTKRHLPCLVWIPCDGCRAVGERNRGALMFSNCPAGGKSTAATTGLTILEVMVVQCVLAGVASWNAESCSFPGWPWEGQLWGWHIHMSCCVTKRCKEMHAAQSLRSRRQQRPQATDALSIQDVWFWLGYFFEWRVLNTRMCIVSSIGPQKRTALPIFRCVSAHKRLLHNKTFTTKTLRN